jgi:hypothetical protein
MGSFIAGAGLLVCRAMPSSFGSAECGNDGDVSALGYAVMMVAMASLFAARIVARSIR